MHKTKVFSNWVSLLVVLKPVLRLKCIKARLLLRERESIGGIEACVKVEMHEGKALFKRVNPLMVLKPLLRLKYMKARSFAKTESLLMVLKPVLRLKCMK